VDGGRTGVGTVETPVSKMPDTSQPDYLMKTRADPESRHRRHRLCAADETNCSQYAGAADLLQQLIQTAGKETARQLSFDRLS
jgi:hypothetical protein